MNHCYYYTTVAPEILDHHIKFNVWATARLLDAAGSLRPEELTRDFGTSDGSIQGTFGHLLMAETIWLARLRGEEQPEAKNSGDPLDIVRGRFADLHRAWQDWASRLTPEDADRIIDYRDLKGNPYSHPLWKLVFHVVNHSTHHRGQISGFIRSLGHTPPSVDLITFVRLGG